MILDIMIPKIDCSKISFISIKQGDIQALADNKNLSI